VNRVLERNLLVRSGAVPKRDRRGDCLEVEEENRERQAFGKAAQAGRVDDWLASSMRIDVAA
jgi:hypothetical protein